MSYRPDEVDYETLAKLFFEIHDPTQRGGQGHDLGEQYASVIFYSDEAEKAVAQSLIDVLKSKGYDVVTELRSFCTFWRAEAYHQDYYVRTGNAPYCHRYQQRF